MLRNTLFSTLMLAGGLLTGAVASSSAPTPAESSAPAKAAPPAPVKSSLLPDYGGRESVGSGVAVTTGSASVASPLGQAGRAFEALAIVLALVIGGLYLLKRSGLVAAVSDAAPAPKAPAKPAAFSWTHLLTSRPAKPIAVPEPIPAAPWLKLIGTQSLPGAPGAALHLVTLAGKTLLLGATAQSVSILTELDAEWEPELADAPAPGAAFDSYLALAPENDLPRERTETELLLSSTTMRLRAMVARSEAEYHARHAS